MSAAEENITDSDGNIALVQAAIDAFNRADREALHALVSEDFVYDWSRSKGPMKGIYHGREGLDYVLDEQWQIFEEFSMEAHEFIARGNHVVVSNTVRARGRSGIEVSANSVHVYTLKDGRAVRLTLYQDRSEALSAASAVP